MTRITSGDLRGRRLVVPPGIRPTTELARKAAFDILGDRIEGARVLDGAAGSGAYGLEALSRGAAEAVFVESSPVVMRVLERNVETMGVKGRATLIRATVDAFLSRPSFAPFDVIFHDPPYEQEGSLEDAARLAAKLSANGVLVHERGDAASPVLPGFRIDRRRYGTTHLAILRRDI